LIYSAKVKNMLMRMCVVLMVAGSLLVIVSRHRAVRPVSPVNTTHETGNQYIAKGIAGPIPSSGHKNIADANQG